MSNADIHEMLSGTLPAIGLFPSVRIDPEHLAELLQEVLRLRALVSSEVEP